MHQADRDRLTRWFQAHVALTGVLHIPTVARAACTALGLGPDDPAAIEDALKDYVADVVMGDQALALVDQALALGRREKAPC